MCLCQSSEEEDEVDSTDVKDFDSALFDVLKVQPEEFAVSEMFPYGQTGTTV